MTGDVPAHTPDAAFFQTNDLTCPGFTIGGGPSQSFGVIKDIQRVRYLVWHFGALYGDRAIEFLKRFKRVKIASAAQPMTPHFTHDGGGEDLVQFIETNSRIKVSAALAIS